MKRSNEYRLLYRVESEPGFRHVLSFKAIRDGGLIVTPGAIPSAGWAMTRTSEVVGFGSVIGKSAIDPVICAAKPRPKLHYHRSGFCSVQPPGGQRVGVHLWPLGSLCHQKIFELFQGAPRDLPIVETLRSHDIWFGRWGDWPDHLVISGVAMQRSEIPEIEKERLDNRAIQIVRGEKAFTVLDLWAHGLDQVIVLDRGGGRGWSPSGVGATTTLTGMCTDGLQPSPMVSLYSNDGRPAVTRTRPWDMPRFPRDPQARTTDRRVATRRRDGTLIEFGEYF